MTTAKTGWRLLASAPDLRGISDCIAKFYCGERKQIVGEDVIGSRGKLERVRVVQRKGRYRFEMMSS